MPAQQVRNFKVIGADELVVADNKQIVYRDGVVKEVIRVEGEQALVTIGYTGGYFERVLIPATLLEQVDVRKKKTGKQREDRKERANK